MFDNNTKHTHIAILINVCSTIFTVSILSTFIGLEFQLQNKFKCLDFIISKARWFLRSSYFIQDDVSVVKHCACLFRSLCPSSCSVMMGPISCHMWVSLGQHCVFVMPIRAVFFSAFADSNSCLITGEGNGEESTSVAESKVPETFVQAGLLHTEKLWEVFGRGSHDFWSFCCGIKGS